MVVEVQRLPFEGLARIAGRLAGGAPLAEVLELIAETAVEVTGAELAVVRVLDETAAVLVARAVAPAGSMAAAELSGSRLDVGSEVGPDRVVVPASSSGRVVGAIELVGELDGPALAAAELLAAHLALALQLQPRRPSAGAGSALERAGDLLAAGAELEDAARQAARDAAEATGARRASVWHLDGEGLELIALEGLADAHELERDRTLAAEARTSWQPLLVDQDPFGTGWTIAIRLGEPAFGVLALEYAAEPRPADLDALRGYSARVAHALRLGGRARDTALELERTRALLSVVGDAIARLSLAHTLETAVERIAALFTLEHVGIYLRAERRLTTAAARDLEPGHEHVAEALLSLAIGALRARETIEVTATSTDPAVAPAARSLRGAEIESALAVPLRVHDETIGLLVAYPGAYRVTTAERKLLGALAAQLAVAVQNARLHEEATRLGEALASVLDSERQAARRLAALYEISNTFTHSLSLESTLQAIAKAIVDVLDVDAAVIRIPDDRGDMLMPGAVHAADERLAEAARTILARPQPHVHLTQPLVLDVDTARRLGSAHALLVPFLVKGSTAVVIPLATDLELLAHLTIVSLDPASPISPETIATASTIAAQASLALDNARLSQQQRTFAETIQRALLPGERPALDGVDVGAVYESAARLNVGGDVYDFVSLENGSVAIVLGDVTGHGVEATADMAMAKFVFRSLVREHPQPADFLAHANEVIADEIAPGKFITMTYLVLHPNGRFSCASAGHPPPRIVAADGTVTPIDVGGLALGIDTGQRYEQADGKLRKGGALVLYTDGVVEARSGATFYGVERLDVCLHDRAGLPAQALAAAVLADCRMFAGGDLRDDCAVVVARKR